MHPAVVLSLSVCACCLPVAAAAQLLDRDLEVAEEQHQTALGAHLMVLDSLLDLQVGWMHRSQGVVPGACQQVEIGCAEALGFSLLTTMRLCDRLAVAAECARYLDTLSQCVWQHCMHTGAA
jgi:hypothetical protein